MVCLFLLIPKSSLAAEVVVFPDPGLDAAVRQAINKPTGDILDTDLVGTGFTYLDAQQRGISDLTGLEHCTDLQGLELQWNNITTLAPLAGLTNLCGLTLFYNQISDLAPLAGLINLNYLNLGINQISDLSPLAGLTNLGTLQIDNNQISDLSTLTGLSSLNWLGLESNPISNLGPLAGRANLIGLFVSQCQIADLAPLAGLTNLIELSFGYNQISDLAPIAGLTSLTCLQLDDNPITDFLPIAGLINLRRIQFGNQVVDLTPLAGLTSLDTLFLSACQTSDLTLLAGLTNLTWLYLDGNQISDLTPLAGLTSLTTLHLGLNQIADLAPLAGLTNLTQLVLDANHIADLAPLVANAGLGAGDYVSLSRNPLSEDVLCEQIPQLQWRGVNVSYDGTCVPPEAQLISAHPSSCVRESTLAVDVTGAYTHFNGSSLISFGAGVTVDSVVVANTTSLTADVSISWDAAPGPRDVTVTTGSEVAFGASLFTVLAGEGEGEGEGGCHLFATLETEGSAVALDRGDVLGPLLGLKHENWTNYSMWDIEGVEAGPPGPFGDGILDLWQLAMFADSYCNPNRWLHAQAVAAHEANLLAVMAEWPEGTNLHEWIAASVSLSSRMRDTVCALFGLNPENYEPVTLPGKGVNEPFSAEGDCDGDGFSNLEEYEYVVAYGGDMEAFVIAASENSPFWNGNPAVPVAGIIGLLLLCVGIAVAHMSARGATRA